MKKILFYLDSFGLGHITRQVALIRAIGKRAQITVACGAHTELLQKSLPGAKIRPIASSLRLIPEGLGIDLEKTRAANRNFTNRFENAVRAEIARMKSEKPDIIVADIPPEPFLAASKLSIPIIAVSNFGWTLIAKHVFGTSSEVYRTYAESYSKASETLVLPFNEPMPEFPNRHKVGLLRRRVTAKMPKTGRILAAFGKSINARMTGRSLHYIPKGAIETQNYVAAARAVFGKPSYGTVSEAVSAGVPLFLKKRPNFPESDWILKNLKGANVVPDGVEAGKWIGEEMESIRWDLIEGMKEKYSQNSDRELADLVLGWA
jgi:UDP-N-acetylglucosamine:LPS N-acetylglucosamine transferase